PGVDDGSRDVSQSLAMLQVLRRQDVEAVALTPHFYARHQHPSEFLSKRADAWDRLRQQLTPDLPATRLGAEVLYFRGVSRSQSLPELCLEGTRLFLLEMPAGKWTPFEIDEVCDLARGSDVRVLLAHINRYWFDQKPAVWEKLLDAGALFQVNAGAFGKRHLRRPMLRLVADGCVYALGTDCHDTGDRGPNMDVAREAILRRLGQSAWDRLDRRTFDDEW
ncbi:MAG: hypothetical protein IKI63_01000, partial [Clostridia bacterium]|nr:hypothetical protein [Clostridia bacterium]